MKRTLSALILLASSELSPCGEPWRAAWVEQVGGQPAKLMAREAGQPARVLAENAGAVTRPLISPDGQTVYFTDLHAGAVPEGIQYAPVISSVSFSGGQPAALTGGLALATGTEEKAAVLYALPGLQTSRKPVPAGEMLVKFSPATPDEREIIWTESPVSPDNFQLSRNGKRAAGMFPWPQAGLANMEDRTFQPVAQGSFPALAPDDSYVLALLSPDRRKIRIFAPGVTPDWELDPAPQLPLKDAALSHLRWTNDALHLVFTASGPQGAGVFLAELRPDLKSIAALTGLSENTTAAWPDVWFPGTGTRTTGLAQKPAITPPAPETKWPATTDGLVFAWEKSGSPANTASLTTEAFALPGRAGALDISAGRAAAPAEAAAKIAGACAHTGAFTVQALITERRTAQPCSRRFLSLTDAAGQDLCALYRVDSHLVLRVRTGNAQTVLTERLTLTPLVIRDDCPFFLTLTLHGQAFTLFIDGEKKKDCTLDQAGLAAWNGPAEFSAGDNAPYGATVPAVLSHVAIYSRALAAEEAADAWHAMESRLPARPTRHKVKLKLLSPAPPLDAAAPGPGEHALAAGTWSVEQVFTGFVKPKSITLLQWSIINGRPAPLPAMQLGQSIELFISGIDEQPELRALPVSYAPGAESLPVYFDTTVPGHHSAPFPP